MSELRQERFDQPHDFDNYLGQLDLELHPQWDEAWSKQDKQLFEKVLFDLGADVSFGYDFTVCLYRSRMTNKVEYGLRASFKERTDAWWTKNMMDTTDVVRNTHNSIRATGMRIGLNDNTPLNEAMMEQAAKLVTIADIKCKDK